MKNVVKTTLPLETVEEYLNSVDDAWAHEYKFWEDSFVSQGTNTTKESTSD